jgi:hypothetical protein
MNAHWSVKIAVASLILLLAGLGFARFRPLPPVANRSAGFSTEHIDARNGVVVFTIDSPLDPDFVTGRQIDAKGGVSHGSLVSRVIRSYCSVPVYNLPAEDLKGELNPESYSRALEWCVRYARENPDVRTIINISLASTSTSDRIEKTIRALHKLNVGIVAAAGNDDSIELTYPAAYREVWAVASATTHGKTLHSNYGEHIDISASGDITFLDYTFLPYRQSLRRMQARGTSFAAPRVTAALAYILQKRPSWRPAGAFNLLQDTSDPIAGQHFERGELGAGLLDMKEVKSSVNRWYKWIHFILPASIGAGLALLTVLLILKRGVVGIFISTLLWIAGMPSAVGLTLILREYFLLVREGYHETGLLPWILLITTLPCCMALLRWNIRKMIFGLTPAIPASWFLGIFVSDPILQAICVALVAACGMLGLYIYLHNLTKRIRRWPVELPFAEAMERLIVMRGKAWDDRMRQVVEEAVEMFPAEEVMNYLEESASGREGASALKDQIAGTLEEGGTESVS